MAAAVTAISVNLLDESDQITVTAATTASREPLELEGNGLDIQALLTKAQPSVVSIHTGLNDDDLLFGGAGSGVVISADGLILTNAHVVAGSNDLTVTLFDGTEMTAELVGSEPRDDVALIAITGDVELVPAVLGSSEELQVGDEVVAIGNALDLGEPSVTSGIVSAKGRAIEAEGLVLDGLIQTDAAINPGNSGGPLLNARGEVVGISTAILLEAQNIGFAIAIDNIEPLIGPISAGEADVTPDDAFLGVGTQLLVDGEGVVVTEIVEGSAAEVAGLRVDDVIVAIDGSPVTDEETLRALIKAHEPGETAEVEYLRGGKSSTITVELGRRGDISS